MGRPVRMAGEEQGRRCQATHKGLVGWGVRISLFSVMGPWGGGRGEEGGAWLAPGKVTPAPGTAMKAKPGRAAHARGSPGLPRRPEHRPWSPSLPGWQRAVWAKASPARTPEGSQPATLTSSLGVFVLRQ